MPEKILTAFLFLASLFVILPAFAKNNHAWPRGDFSELRAVGTAEVEQIIDPHTIRLDDKRIIRLAGIEYPDFNPNMPGTFSVMTVKILKDLLEGKRVNVYQTMGDEWGRTNRMGQQLAHLELQAGSAWIQGTVLELGLARVMTDKRNPEMAGQMYKLENTARQKKEGIWSLERYKALTPEEAKNYTGSVSIVEGRIRSTAMKQNRIYLNFGPDWKSDFTVMIAPENRRLFFDRGIDPLKWNGKTVRVRGWVGNYNGPFIEINHPEQIEMIDEKDTKKDGGAFSLKVTTEPPMLRSTANH